MDYGRFGVVGCEKGFGLRTKEFFVRLAFVNIGENVSIMIRHFLIILFTAILVIAVGCSNVGLKDPVALTVSKKTVPDIANRPKFLNGDVVRHKLLGDKFGIMMHAGYKYVPDLNAWYCIVDFYPPSMLGMNFSGFNGFERRYLYEFELESVAKNRDQIQKYARWQHMSMTSQ
jgi:hypothetical protein